MPEAIFVPARLADLAVDVLLSTPAQGDVLYYDGAHWKNLPHGTAGQVLTTQGASANPQWSAPGMPTGAVVTAPSTSAQNTIQPTSASVVPLTLQGASGQSAPAQQWAGSNSNVYAKLSLNPGILEIGDVTGGGAAQGGIILRGENGAACLTMRNDPGSSSSVDITSPSIFWSVDSWTWAAPQTWKVYSAGSPFTFEGYTPYGTDTNPPGTGGGGVIFADIYTGCKVLDIDIGGSQIRAMSCSPTAPFVTVTGAAAQSAPLLTLQQISSTVAVRATGVVDAVFAVATDATRQGRLVLSAVDYNATREGLRIEANGTAAAIGFLGASAVVRQTGASAAGIAAISDANAKAAVSALQTALANLGLITSPA